MIKKLFLLMTGRVQPVEAVEDVLRSLSDEIDRLNKIVTALMNRAERSASNQHSDFGMFQATLMLESQVRERTEALEESLHENEKINRLFDCAGGQGEILCYSVKPLLFSLF